MSPIYCIKEGLWIDLSRITYVEEDAMNKNPLNRYFTVHMQLSEPVHVFVWTHNDDLMVEIFNSAYNRFMEAWKKYKAENK